MGGRVGKLTCPLHSHKQLILCVVLTISLPSGIIHKARGGRMQSPIPSL